MPVFALIGVVAGGFLAIEHPQNALCQALFAIYRSIQWLPRLVGLVCAIVLVAGIALLDFKWGGLGIPSSFYVYLIPVFLSSFLFGKRAAVAAWLVSFLMVAYLVIPPRFSFAIATMPDFMRLLVFAVAAGIVLAVPLAQRSNSNLAEDSGE